MPSQLKGSVPNGTLFPGLDVNQVVTGFSCIAMRYYPGLFMNTAAPSLVPLLATDPSSVARMHCYESLPQNPLQAKARRDHQEIYE